MPKIVVIEGMQARIRGSRTHVVVHGPFVEYGMAADFATNVLKHEDYEIHEAQPVSEEYQH